MMQEPERRILAGGRERWRHGPIDLVIKAWGAPDAVAQAHANAWTRFQGVLAELVAELAALKTPVAAAPGLHGAVARRMLAACTPFAPAFITPMAAVAGSVADEILRPFLIPGVDRAYVNNGGDIAIHLAPGQTLNIGVIPDLDRPGIDGSVFLEANGPVRGIATSGWRGRSFSLGIADSVTVLARDAGMADAAATMIANAVNIDHPAVKRRPACEIKDDSDLGDRLVTVEVGAFAPAEAAEALARGAGAARGFLDRGLIDAAALALQAQWRIVGSGFPKPVDAPVPHAIAA